MKQIELEKWEDFEKRISETFEDCENKRKESQFYVSPPLFRGHENASWKLQTTMERLKPGEWPIENYYKVMCSVLPTVQSFTEKSWDLGEEYKKEEGKPNPPQGYEFMVYLRQLGFPSPLLDWSRSPYVAAFFAFRHGRDSEEKHIAIYSYLEYYGGAKGWMDAEAAIFGIGPYITTHKRHHNQQCEYTLCKKSGENTYVYCNHEDALKKVADGQDILTKYSLPRSERFKVLEKLNLMNINSYSLFGNEESLMETLAYKELEREILLQANTSTKPTSS